MCDHSSWIRNGCFIFCIRNQVISARWYGTFYATCRTLFSFFTCSTCFILRISTTDIILRAYIFSDFLSLHNLTVAKDPLWHKSCRYLIFLSMGYLTSTAVVMGIGNKSMVILPVPIVFRKSKSSNCTSTLWSHSNRWLASLSLILGTRTTTNV